MRIEATVNAAGRLRDGLADIRIRSETGEEHQLDLPFRDVYRRCGAPDPLALDLLITASICYVVDKTVSRASASNGWTREFELSVPVSDAGRWAPVANNLADTLTFLTGDIWRFSFYQSAEPFFQRPKREPVPVVSAASAVSLFSGGLDSLAGAIDLLNNPDVERVLLIGHYDSGGPRKVQADLAATLRQRYPKRVDVLHARVAHRPNEAAENTLRSRSFVFIALGLYAAHALGPETPLYMFENGLIALNVPLTPSRQGSCSTRTMHPYYLLQMRTIISALGIGKEIINPYALKTKGECVEQCANRALLSQLAPTSVSCSHAFRKQDWVRKNADNCGYCVPCIFRRAALNKVDLDHGEQYGLDVLSDELSIADQLESADDLRAVTDFLRETLTPATLRKKIVATAQFPNLDAYAEMAYRGFAELRAWLNSANGTATTSVTAKHA